MARILCVALCVAIFLGVSFRSQAQNIQVASSVVCDTAEQIKMFGSLVDEVGSKAALDRVNEDAKDPMACVAGTVAYFVATRGEVMTALGSRWHVTKITVVGIVHQGAMQHVNPIDLYALTPTEDRPA